MPSAIRVIDQADEIVTDTTNFNNNLSGSDSDVQTALETIDDMSAGSPGGSDKQIQYNNSAAFGGATGFEWQNASPNITIIAQNAAHVPLLVKAAASQSANIQEWKDSDSNVLAGVDERGVLFSHANIDTNSVFIGEDSGRTAASGALNNVAIGKNTMKALTDGDSNMAFGYQALAALTEGGGNAAIGYNACWKLTTGDGNLGIGTQALFSVTTTGGSIGIGTQAGYYSTAATNIFVGYQSGHGVNGQTTGTLNIGIGRATLKAFTTGGYNVAIGHYAGDAITTSARNVLIGYSAGGAMAIASNNNILIGYQAGDNLTTGNDNIIIGYNLDVSAVGVNYELNIGGLLKGDTNANKMGFFQTAAITKPEVTGARDETEGALADLLTELANLGLITDSTTAS